VIKIGKALLKLLPDLFHILRGHLPELLLVIAEGPLAIAIIELGIGIVLALIAGVLLGKSGIDLL
jgi:hypothetical protein